MAKKITFVNNKGGVLKTSLTVNYAAVLATKGFKILIIDTDSQNNVLTSFVNPLKKKIEINYTLYDLVFHDAKIKDAIVNIYKNIDLITPGKNWRKFEEAQLEAMHYGEKTKHIKEIISEIENNYNYDYILFDTEPKKSLSTFSTLLVADGAIIPFTFDAYGFEGLAKMQVYIEDAQKRNSNLKIEALVATKTLKRSKLEKVFKEQNFFPKPGLCEVSIPRSISNSNSITFENLPIYLTTKNIVSQAYEDLVNLLEFKKVGK
ncbi:ParA family protein [Mesomycoplasma neurolyticum]|uniref:ParA/Soj family protein n=1 Tax=Mesomycoplasma neurolyticum TaxID=2120 RepID=A0A449A4V5_9BACT|nr:ParA family protein [Mesomycoplasma neurolyticum]VEU59320.1 ParA/Soj family protein [Mesomycoplasma neurolyticum]